MHALTLAFLMQLQTLPEPAAAKLPPITPADLWLFPQWGYAQHALHASLSNKWFVQNLIPLSLPEEDYLAAWLEELRYCSDCWDALDWVRIYAEAKDDKQMCRWLGILRDRIGPDNFYRGIMPPLSPWWRSP